jgi:alkaline phosphatase
MGRLLSWRTLLLAILGLSLTAVLFAGSQGWRLEIHPPGGWHPGGEPLVFEAPPPPPEPLAGASEGPPRNVVILLGDGLGAAALVAAKAELAGVNGRLALEALPVTGQVLTHSVNNLITDSAAAATAMTTGFKTRNGRIGVDAQGEPLVTLGEAAISRGMALGLVTSSYLCDATPTAFVGHATSRRECSRLLTQMAASGAEVLLGEEPSIRDAPFTREDAEAIFLAEGYTVARSAKELEGLRDLPAGEKVVALFDFGSVASPDQGPDLPALAAFALERLRNGPGGFLLLVEEEEIDTGGHNHDLQRLVAGVASLDQATAEALRFAREDGSTLIVLTGDHETGGLTLVSGSQGDPLGVRWGTTYHSAVPVPLFAGGPGAEALGGWQDNTELPRRLAELLGLELSP